MKYIYSYWSKPLLKKINSLPKDEYSKLLKRVIDFHSVSLNLLKKVSTEVELITDDFGYEHLSFLPFAKITKDLNNINSFDSDLWSIAKIYALSLYNEPVCHIDYDFFLKNDSGFQNIINQQWDILVQGKEISPNFKILYSDNIKLFLNLLDENFKQTISEFLYFDSYNYMYNCGVLGFKNLIKKDDYIKKTTAIFNHFNQFNLTKQFYEKSNFYAKRSTLLFVPNLNTIIEQFFLCIWSNYYNLYVKELSSLSEWTTFDEKYKKLNNYQIDNSMYYHPMGNLKNKIKIDYFNTLSSKD